MVTLINNKSNIFGDDIAFAEQWDFSRANMNEENRINAITKVASICYQNPKALNSDSLYNRLMAESMGLPSSSFEFVPVLFDMYYLNSFLREKGIKKEDTKIFKHGEKVENENYLLTNFRAIVYDYEKLGIDLRNIFNTEEECEIIKQHFKVFLYKVDFPTRSQMVRHRVNWQELSRRYVSGKRIFFDFYISENMKDVYVFDKGVSVKGSEAKTCFTVQDSIDIAVKLYYAALEKGVKPQEARRIIPQAAYTQIWGAFQPTQYENFMKLRDDEVHAQWEIAQVAKAMRELVNG
jgi:thymidylate synthase (FAD)